MNHQDKKLTSFLAMTIGSALDDYMANLAKKHQVSEQKIDTIEDNILLVKQEKNKLEQLVKERDKRISDLGVQLRQKDNELAAGRKNLEKAEADLVLANKSNRELMEREKQHSELIQVASDAVRERLEALEYTADLFDSATTKIKDMEDAVSKLLSKVTIPSTMIRYMKISNHLGRIEEWGCREGGLIRPDDYDVIKVNSDWLYWSLNGFLISKLKKEGENVLEGELVAKYVNLD